MLPAAGLPSRLARAAGIAASPTPCLGIQNDRLVAGNGDARSDAGLGQQRAGVTFIFNSDEEIGSPASRKVIVEEAKRHDLALVLEPGRPGPDLTVERKGVAILHLDVEGREAHAGAEPEKGLNSIVELARKTLAIQALNDAGAGTTVTPGVVNGGTKPYVVPGRARLSVDCRVVSMQEQARVTAGIEEAAKRSWIGGTRATLSGGFHRPPMQASELTMRYVARFQEAARAAGYPLGAGSTGGAWDGNLTAAAGTATIDGLGVHGARAHSREEYAEVPSLVAKCRALAAFLKNLGERPPDHRASCRTRSR